MWRKVSASPWLTVRMILAYLILLLCCLTGYGLGTQEEVQPRHYVPKSQRRPSIAAALWIAIMAAAQATFKLIADRVETLKARRRLARAIRNLRPERKHTRFRRDSVRHSNLLPKKLTLMVAIAMQADHGAAYRAIRYDTDSGPVGIDNRCTACISHKISDFDGPLQDVKLSIRGFAGSRTTGLKRGTIVWRWEDDSGNAHKFRIPNSYYVPAGKVRLLSPQHLAQAIKDTKGTGEDTNGERCHLYWMQRKHSLTVRLDENNVATFNLAPSYNAFQVFCQEAGFDNANEYVDPIICESVVTDDESSDAENDAFEPTTTTRDFEPDQDSMTFDLDGPSTTSIPEVPDVVPDEEDRVNENLPAMMLKLHQHFGHVSFAKLKKMAQAGTIPKKFARCPAPVCSACMYAKATRRQWRHRNAINRDNVVRPRKPGDVVSVDQLISPTPGLIAQLSGFITKERYKVATIYVDQVSRVGFVNLQRSTSAEETLEGKQAFERWASTHGVHVRAYHADNGIFRANEWVRACHEQRQPLTFASVGAHHQNGLAERRIRELQDTARTMLIHANRRWPIAVDAHLWPFALRTANEIFNITPNLQDPAGRSPLQVFSDSPVDVNVKHYKPFGCPVYVLDPSIQEGKKAKKWTERSKVGIYLGQSPVHSRNVALVLTESGHVSPQFHVSFDPGFQTIREEGSLVSKAGAEWKRKCHFTSFDPKETSDGGAQEPARPKFPLGASAASGGAVRKRRRESTPTRKRGMANPEGGGSTPNSEGATDAPASEGGSARERAGIRRRGEMHQPEGRVQAPVLPTQEQANGRSDQAATDESNATASRTRSGRTVHPATRLIEAMTIEIVEATKDKGVEGEIFCLQAMFPDEQETPERILAMKATADPDTMYLHEAMREPDWSEFLKAMQKEIDDQMQNGNYVLVRRADIPEDEVVFPAVWQMKRKRDIRTREIKKYKARCNFDGSRMIKGRHYDQTYSPVASWNSIRLLLTMVATQNWKTRQLDYVLAFPQAPVQRDLYMEIPKGIKVDGADKREYALKLKKNVYGQKDAGRVWFQFLRKKLIEEVGFKQSEVDECVFYRGKTMYVLYTDDSLIAGPDEDEIERIIEDIKAAKLDITIEGNIEDFLGINIDRQDDGSIKMTQPHLIDQILKDLKFQENTKPKDTPAKSSVILSRHSDSEPFDESFHYKSLIGKLGYLEKGTRSDISYIAHQCARFSSNPKKEHGDAIRWIGRYLMGTKDKGTILRPDPTRDLEVFVDADFAGNWDPEESLDRDTARSRHGYIIMYKGCPILWKSQLQGEICLSSTESEYTGLSYALREVIPIMRLLQEMKELGFQVGSTTPEVHCKVFEDNSGALEMAKVHKHRARTKHINVKLHHFRDYVSRGEISIHPIESENQLSDYLTKPVNVDILAKLRKIVMGW